MTTDARALRVDLPAGRTDVDMARLNVTDAFSKG